MWGAEAPFFRLEIQITTHVFRRRCKVFLEVPSAICSYLHISFSTQASQGPGEAPPSKSAGKARAWQPGPGAPDPRGFLQASLGPQSLWWPLLSNLGPGLGGNRSLSERTGKRGCGVRGLLGKGPAGRVVCLGVARLQSPTAPSPGLHPWETEPREAAGQVLRGSLLPLESCLEKCQFSRSPLGVLWAPCCSGEHGDVGPRRPNAWLASLFPRRVPRARSS